jgi:uncharacterized protein (DUF2236 family)
MTDDEIKKVAQEHMKGITYGMPMPRSWKEIVAFGQAIRREALQEAARECDRVANQAAKFSLGPQQDCANELASNIRELAEQALA